MKRIIAIFFVILGMSWNAHAQTATNFISTDCGGNVHNLFTELDTGRVVVLTWVMPCGGCIGPAQTSYAVAQSYGQQYPGRVVYYIADDYGNISCSNLTSWAFTNGMHCICFSDSTIRMSDYGADAMPKTIILGGYDHHVYYMNDLGADTTAMHAAIDAALLATGIDSPVTFDNTVSVFPNPANESADISFVLNDPSHVVVSIYALYGELVQEFDFERQYAGVFRERLDCSALTEGAYIIRITNGDKHAERLLTVHH